jgi:hypothetical protein
MLLREFVPLCTRRYDLGRDRRRALIGWSMGGYGALLAAETEPHLFRAVACSGPAVWTSYAAMMLGPRDAFDSAEDFAQHGVIAHADRLRGLGVRIDCGRHDPFYPLRHPPRPGASRRRARRLQRRRPRPGHLQPRCAGGGALHRQGAGVGGKGRRADCPAGVLGRRRTVATPPVRFRRRSRWRVGGGSPMPPCEATSPHWSLRSPSRAAGPAGITSLRPPALPPRPLLLLSRANAVSCPLLSVVRRGMRACAARSSPSIDAGRPPGEAAFTHTYWHNRGDG